jgi:hypothetical protein
MTASTFVLTPHDKMLQSFPDARESGGYWHHEDNPRFDWRVHEDGHVSIKSWTNRDYKDILSMGNPALKPRDLYPQQKNGYQADSAYQKPSVLTLLDLRDYLKLDVTYLLSLGYQEDYAYRDKEKGRTYTGVKVGGYYAPDGTPHERNKIRLSIDPNAKPRFLWDRNMPGEPIPCGLHKLDMAREQGFLTIGEGETDFATMLFHGMPFVGIGGADACKQLDVSLILDIPRIYILEEPDQALKNLEYGQGFYKNMRAHLRDNGYQGDIFSIKFKQATGCKDPSDLHKSLYACIDMNNGVVSRSDLHEQFCSALRSAMDNAIPEGQPCEDTGVAPWIPPMPTNEQTRLQWVAELVALPAHLLSPSQKMTLISIVLHTPLGSSRERWKVDADHLSKMAGQSKDIFLDNLTYLEKKLPLFEKKHERRWHETDNGKAKPSTDLYIQPRADVWLAYPSTYKLADGVEARKQGGLQVPKPKGPTCPHCHSDDVDVQRGTYCYTCHTSHLETVYTSPIAPQTLQRTTVTQEEPQTGPLPGVDDAPMVPEPEPEPEETQEKSSKGNLPPLYTDIDILEGQVAPVTFSEQNEPHLSIVDGHLSCVDSSPSPPPFQPGQFIRMPDKRTGQVVEMRESTAMLEIWGHHYEYELEQLRLCNPSAKQVSA